MGGLKTALTFIFGLLLQLYALGSAVTSTLLLISYPWGFISQAQCFTGAGFISFFVVFVATMFTAVIGSVVRMFLWLPSLIHWWIAGGEPSFLAWLMPGLSIGCGR